MKLSFQSYLWGAALGLSLAWVPVHAQTAASPATKVLRYAFPVAETGFDPARIVDLYSRIVTAHIFESLYTYDHLARPAKIKPLIAEGMPETDRKSTRLNSSHVSEFRMPSSA